MFINFMKGSICLDCTYWDNDALHNKCPNCKSDNWSKLVPQDNVCAGCGVEMSVICYECEELIEEDEIVCESCEGFNPETCDECYANHVDPGYCEDYDE